MRRETYAKCFIIAALIHDRPDTYQSSTSPDVSSESIPNSNRSSSDTGRPAGPTHTQPDIAANCKTLELEYS